MNIDNLKKVLIPPMNPFSTGTTEGWASIEKELNTPFPNDYKLFIETYGTGGIDNFLWFLTPFDEDENINYLKRTKIILWSYQYLKNDFPQYYIHDVHPVAGGLLPWGYTDNGNELYWRTTGIPDVWPVVVYESRGPDFYEYNLSLTNFLVEILTKRIICKAFPSGFPSDDATYIATE